MNTKIESLFSQILELKREAFEIFQDKKMIRVYPDKLIMDDLSVLKNIFSMFFDKDEKPTNLFLWISPLTRSDSNLVLIIEANSFINIDKLLEKIRINHTLMFLETSLLPAFFSVLHENNIPINWADWCKEFQKKIRHARDYNPEVIEQIVSNFFYMYDLAEEKDALKSLLFPTLFFIAIVNNKVDNITPILKQRNCVHWIAETDASPYCYYLKAALFSNDSFKHLLEIFDIRQAKLDNKNKDNLLHLCADQHLLTALNSLEYSSWINCKNNRGETPLSIAIKGSNLYRASLLIAHGANTHNTSNQAESFWRPKNSLSDIKNDLDSYIYYHNNGKVLTIPPLLYKQRGLNCGLYAVKMASNFYRLFLGHLFKEPELPVRKKEFQPKAQNSLRHMRKDLGISRRVGIFSTKELQSFITQTECKSLVCEIEDFASFKDTIKKAIDLNFPIIIPYSCDPKKGMPDITGSTQQLHWATIIGWMEDSYMRVLFMQNGRYCSTFGKNLYEAFYNMGEEYPGAIITKNKESREWERVNTVVEGMEIETILPIDLTEDFRRKLVIVLPPEYNLCNAVDEFVKITPNMYF